MRNVIHRKVGFLLALALVSVTPGARSQTTKTNADSAPVAADDDPGAEELGDDWEPFARSRRGGLNFIYLGVDSAVQRFNFNRHTLVGQNESGSSFDADNTEQEILLDGSSWAAGIQIRGGYQNDWGLRFGVSGGMRIVAQLDRLQPRLLGEPTRLESLTFGNFGVSIGKAFDAEILYPYVDVEASIAIGNATLVDDANETDEPEIYAMLAPSLAVRAGAIVPLSDLVYLDLSVRHDIVGLGGLGGQLGIGFLMGPSEED